ncbi:hypothetical protein [Kitasatospora sp. NPDC005856]|uniref:hypothetical protein n=1 Tax=Kitasatospora sp. NPDC005856 TaxID=3154566 RepID=UPI0033DC1F00
MLPKTVLRTPAPLFVAALALSASGCAKDGEETGASGKNWAKAATAVSEFVSVGRRGYL